MTVKLQDTFSLLCSRVSALRNSFGNALAAKKRAIEICLLPTIIKQGEVKKRKKEKAVLEFYQRDDSVKTGEKQGLNFTSHIWHALCELPCSTLCLPFQPGKWIPTPLWGDEKELLLPLQTHTEVSPAVSLHQHTR